MDVELNRAEAELQNEEATLHAELTKLNDVSTELSQRLQLLRAKATSAGENAIAARASAQVPALDEGQLAVARQARALAVKARRDCNTAARAQVLAAKSALQRLAQQVLADEKLVAAAEVRARDAAVPQGFAPLPSAPTRPSVAPVTATPKTEPMRAAELPTAADTPAAKKRHSPRVKMQAAVDFTSDNNFFNGFSANISDGGLFVATINVLPLGTEVDLNFTLPSGERVEAKGVVRWVREVNDKLPDAFPGLGVQFSALTPTAQNAINQFLAQRDPLFFADAE